MNKPTMLDVSHIKDFDELLSEVLVRTTLDNQTPICINAKKDLIYNAMNNGSFESHLFISNLKFKNFKDDILDMGDFYLKFEPFNDEDLTQITPIIQDNKCAKFISMSQVYDYFLSEYDKLNIFDKIITKSINLDVTNFGIIKQAIDEKCKGDVKFKYFGYRGYNIINGNIILDDGYNDDRDKIIVKFYTHDMLFTLTYTGTYTSKIHQYYLDKKDIPVKPILQNCEDSCMSIPVSNDTQYYKELAEKNWNTTKDYIKNFKELHPSKQFVLIIPKYYYILDGCLDSHRLEELGLLSGSEHAYYKVINYLDSYNLYCIDVPSIYSIDSNIATTINFFNPSDNKVLK